MLRTLILTRDMKQPLDPRESREEPVAVSGSSAPAFKALDEFCGANGFPGGWAARMLSLGAGAWLVMRDGRAGAAGWLARTPFFIEEIGRTFDPGPDGDYYFGDFVAPAFRGMGFQRGLIDHRLAASRDAGRRWVTAVADDRNRVSLQNYQRVGFIRAGELVTRSCCGLRIEQLRRFEQAHGKFSHRGLSLPFSLCLSSARRQR